MTDLVAWLSAQLDHDDHVARAARPGFFTTDVLTRVACAADARHVIVNDPARVLRTVTAHRAILNAYETALASRDVAQGTALAGATRLNLRIREDAVRTLASIYAERPGYDPAWTPSAEPA